MGVITTIEGLLESRMTKLATAGGIPQEVPNPTRGHGSAVAGICDASLNVYDDSAKDPEGLRPTSDSGSTRGRS